jgi:hypothetical protein
MERDCKLVLSHRSHSSSSLHYLPLLALDHCRTAASRDISTFSTRFDWIRVGEFTVVAGEERRGWEVIERRAE